MTRINASIEPAYLVDQHLLAEYRELPRVATLFKRRIKKNVGFDDVPEIFTLGEGHVKFFMTKHKYLINRFNNIRDELILRNYDVKFDDSLLRSCFEGFEHLNVDWNPDEDVKRKVTDRVLQKFPKRATYNKKPITKQRYIEML